MRRNLTHLILVSTAAALAACSGEERAPATTTNAAPAESENPSGAAEQTETERLNAWFEQKWNEMLERSPERKTFLGIKTDYDKWDDESDAFAVETHEMALDNLAEMRATFDYDALDPSAQMSYRLFEYDVELDDKRFAYRNHWYEFSQFRGPHSGIPAFLINQHRVDTKEDAEAYVARLEGVREHMAQYQENAEAQFANRVNPPKWSYAQMMTTAENVISGAPYEDGEPSALWADLNKKVDALDLPQSEKDEILARGEAALLNSVRPAYESIIAMFKAQQAQASNDDGAWKLPDGEAYYGAMLNVMTTTDMSAEEIHDLGLAEVQRIHEEMNVIKDAVGFEGSLQDFFVYMRTDPDEEFTYPNTEEGRAQYLAEATAIIDNMRGRLDELFYTKPKAELVVKRVEPFREKAAGKAFYQRPAPDGSRPGVYYANLYNMADMPSYQMEALAYHEGIPGHHMQIAIAQELEATPKFRRFGGFTAYSEGWGLYSEYAPKEMGLYADPYSDFGRLAMELWRAARLVVDTGLHDKKWTRQEAIDYLLQNTPNPEGDCVKAIERYIVMPGQATAYKVGMLKILDLRARAEEALGDEFEVRAFHDVVLANGPVPLAILEQLVDAWIDDQRAA